MKKSKLFSVLAVCGIALAGVVSCQNQGGDNPEAPLSLTVWAPLEHQDLYQDFIAQFKEAHPEYADATFELGACSEADAYAQVSKDPTTAADVYSFANDQLYNLINVGGLTRVGGEYETFVKENNSEGMITAASNEAGELYAYPISADNGYYLTYDTSVVTEYDENTTFFDVAAQCAAAGKKFVVPMGDAWYGYGFFSGFGATYEVTYTEGKETAIECDYNGAAGLKAGGFLVDFAGTDGFQYVDGGNSGDQSLVLNNYIGSHADEIGAFVGGTWLYQDAAGVWGEDNTACNYLPLMEEGNTSTRMRSFIGGKMVGVNPNADNLVLAHDFAEFISDTDCQLQRFEALGMGPSNLTALENEDVASNKALVGLNAQVAKAGDPQLNVPSTFWTAVQNFGTAVGYQKTVNHDNLQSELDKLVEDITTIA